MRRVLPVLALLVLVGCEGNTTPSPSPLVGGGLLVQVQGTVSIRRQGWTGQTPALFGVPLQTRDHLIIDGTATATVLCADRLHLVAAQPGDNVTPCPALPPIIEINGSQINIGRGSGVPPGVPQVLLPRNTQLLDPRPMLRWRAVPGVQTYQVNILHGGSRIWAHDVHVPAVLSITTELPYPSTQPQLSPDTTYTLLVQAGTAHSTDEQDAALGFSLLPADQAAAVNADAHQIQDLGGLQESQKRFLLAQLYAKYGLRAEAAQQLEGVSAVLAEPSVFRSLGALYGAMELNDLATKQYRQALTLSQGRGDVEGQALAEHALARLVEAAGVPDGKQQAVDHLQQALQHYQQLGDQTMIGAIQHELQQLH